MATICPTVLADNSHTYREQIERVAGFAKRIHLDFSDGIFAPKKTIDLDNVWLPDDIHIDLHIMHQLPGMESKQLIALKPNLVIVHAEAEGSYIILAEKLRKHGIKAGVALLPETDPYSLRSAMKFIDHVLLFSGNLGEFGGQADLGLLKKIKVIRHLKPHVEIGWDGGINDENASEIAKAGVNVLNVGGYIQRADNPKQRFEHLKSLLH